MTRQLNVGMALMGLLGFALLMALRTEVSGMAARGALAALAFICAAMALVYIGKAWR